jgi:hypothetical protein
MGESFFVADSQVTTSPALEPAALVLGHIERTCNGCGADWTVGQTSCSRCHGQVFDERFVAPALLERVAGRILGVATPETPKVKPLKPADIAVFERCAGAARAFVAALADADRTARQVVNSDRASGSMAFLQDKLHNVSGTAGDFSPSVMTTSMALPALTLATLIDDMVRQHAGEVT